MATERCAACGGQGGSGRFAMEPWSPFAEHAKGGRENRAVLAGHEQCTGLEMT